MKAVSCQTFRPPSHGILSGKFAPPATMSAPPLVPAKEPAKPIASGNGASCCQSSETFAAKTLAFVETKAANNAARVNRFANARISI
jgi:hypothetical protein